MVLGQTQMTRWQTGRVRWEPIRLLLASADLPYRQGLRAVFEQMGDMEVVGEAASGPHTVSATEATVPDIVLLDAGLVDAQGRGTLYRILEKTPHVGVVLLLESEDPEQVFQGIRAGARGYVVRGTGPQTVRRRIKAAFRGEVILSPVVTAALLERVGRAPRPQAASPLGELITQRERQVLQLGADGLSTKEIAAKLGLSEKTVRNHMTSIYSKLRARDRTQAILAALREGLITLPEEEDE